MHHQHPVTVQDRVDPEDTRTQTTWRKNPEFKMTHLMKTSDSFVSTDQSSFSHTHLSPDSHGVTGTFDLWHLKSNLFIFESKWQLVKLWRSWRGHMSHEATLTLDDQNRTSLTKRVEVNVCTECEEFPWRRDVITWWDEGTCVNSLLTNTTFWILRIHLGLTLIQ